MLSMTERWVLREELLAGALTRVWACGSDSQELPRVRAAELTQPRYHRTPTRRSYSSSRTGSLTSAGRTLENSTRRA